MKKLFTLGLLVTALTFGVNSAKADGTTTAATEATANVPAVAEIGLSSTTATLSFGTPSAIGEGFTTTTDATAYLQFTTVLSSSITSYTISAAVDAIPAGCKLTVSAGDISGSESEGTLGTAQKDVELSTTDATIVSGIGSAHTGSGDEEGYPLTYTFSTSTFANVVSGDNSITITYTITSES